MSAQLPTVILFGSAARGDNDAKSDIDVLILEKGAFPHALRKDKLEIQTLSTEEAQRKAENGDLFMIHILHEGVVMSDPCNFFAELRESLVIRRSYNQEKREALILASFIEANWRSFGDTRLLNKRIAWSVRTAVIAELVEEGRLIFSPKGVCESINDLDIVPLVEMRRSLDNPEMYIPLLRRFIITRGGGEFLDLDFKRYADSIKALGKSVALSTFHGLLNGSKDAGY